MDRQTSSLDRIHIASPCSVDWSEMKGTEQVRFCGQCQKSVYNFSRMTRAQAEALIANTPGRLCARFDRATDGMILTEDYVTGLRGVRRRASIVAGAAFTAMLGLLNGSGATAQTHTHAGSRQVSCAHNSFKISRTPTRTPETQSTLTGTVFDINSAVIPGAYITLTNESDGNSQKGMTSEEGIYRFMSLDDSLYTLKIEAAGFHAFIKEHISLNAGEELRFDVTLQAGMMGEIITIPRKRTTQRIASIIALPYKGIKKILASGPR